MAQPSTKLTIVPVLPKATAVTFGLAGSAVLSPANSGSSGGWQIVDRPRQKAITQWYDASPQQLELSLILSGSTVEGDCARVFGWQYPTAGQQQPPVLAIKGPLSPQARNLYWCLYTLKIDDDKAIRDPNSGSRTLQPVDLTLYEFVPATASVLTHLSPAKAAQSALTAASAATSRRTYVVRVGDTLSKIAARELGNHALWPEIASLNGIRDPNSLKPGTRIVLPA